MRTILTLLITPLLSQNIEECPDSLREMVCSKGGTENCEMIGSDPGHRCNCRPGFNGPDCSNFDYELQCDQSHVFVKARKYYFDEMGVDKDDLSLNENTDDCLATEETNENGVPFYIFKIIGSPANCGSYVTSNNTHLKYTNAIRDAETTADAKIVTRSKIEIQFHCSFPVDYHVGLSNYLKPNVRTLTMKTDEGEFVIEMRAFQDQSFQREWLPPSEGQPIEIAKGQYLPLKISLTNVVSKGKLYKGGISYIEILLVMKKHTWKTLLPPSHKKFFTSSSKFFSAARDLALPGVLTRLLWVLVFKVF
jgi:hypothetical protein